MAEQSDTEPSTRPMSRSLLERGSARWRDEVRSWAGAALAAEGAAVGEVCEHLSQPWSSIWTVTSDQGRFWLKENGPSQRAEGTVHATVAALAPAYVDAPVAVDPERGWMLTRDGGQIAETLVVEPRGVPVGILVEMVRDYARLQRLTVGHRDRLVEAGLGVLEPSDAAGLARAQTEYFEGLDPDDPRHLTEEHGEEIVTILPALEEAGQALAAGPVPLALDQGDFLPTNAFLPRGGGSYRVFDFADAIWTHPFCSLVMLAKDYLRRSDQPQPDDVFDLRHERIAAVLDAYLDVWGDLAPPDVLHDLLRHALRIGPLLRSRAWLQAFDSCDAAALTHWGADSWWWLQRLTKPVVL